MTEPMTHAEILQTFSRIFPSSSFPVTPLGVIALGDTAIRDWAEEQLLEWVGDARAGKDDDEGFFAGILDGIRDEVVERVRAAAGGALEGIGDAIEGVGETLEDVGGVVEGVGGLIPGPVGDAIEKVGDTIEGAGEAIDAAGEGLGGLADAVTPPEPGEFDLEDLADVEALHKRALGLAEQIAQEVHDLSIAAGVVRRLASEATEIASELLGSMAEVARAAVAITQLAPDATEEEKTNTQEAATRATGALMDVAGRAEVSAAATGHEAPGATDTPTGE